MPVSAERFNNRPGRYRKTALLIVVLIQIAGFRFTPAAHDPLTASNKTPSSSATQNVPETRLIAAPILFYTPETTWAFGAAGSLVFYLGDPATTRPSSISPLAIYTLEDQFRTLMKSEIFTSDNRYHLVSEIKFERFPSLFFGLGAHTLIQAGETFVPRFLNTYVSMFKQIIPGFEAGIQIHFKQWSIEEDFYADSADHTTVPGGGRAKILGIGFLASFDNRDNIFSPRSGHFLEIEAKTYPGRLCSQYDYSSVKFNARKYLPLFSHHVLALQGVFQSQDGTVPFHEMARLGGETNMRGYYEGRFRDHNLLLIQAEYRLPLAWRLGVVAFAGLGNVAGRASDLFSGEWKQACGAGVRFLWDRKERIRIRLDFGFGEDSSGVYFSIYEAF